jgi:hypothetical protein
VSIITDTGKNEKYLELIFVRKIISTINVNCPDKYFFQIVERPLNVIKGDLKIQLNVKKLQKLDINIGVPYYQQARYQI